MKQPTDWQFRDQKVPARVCYLLQQGTINVTDLLLFFVIDALVKPQGQEDGLGCYAGNPALAQAVNVVPHYVSERLHHLHKLGLVVICHLGNQRYLELEWSRTGEERKALAGEYGKIHRKAYRHMLDNLHLNGVYTKVYGGFTQKCKGALHKSVNIIDNEESKVSKIPSRRNGKGINAQSSLPAEGIPLCCYEWNDRAHQILRSRRPPIAMTHVSRDSGAACLYQLWKRWHKDSSRMNRLLDGLENNIQRLKKPVPSSVRQLCNPNTINWLEQQVTNQQVEEEVIN